MKDRVRGSRSDSGGGGSISSSSVSLASDGVALSTGSWEGGNMVESEETSNEETVCGPRQRKTVDYTMKCLGRMMLFCKSKLVKTKIGVLVTQGREKRNLMEQTHFLSLYKAK